MIGKMYSPGVMNLEISLARVYVIIRNELRIFDSILLEIMSHFYPMKSVLLNNMLAILTSMAILSLKQRMQLIKIVKRKQIIVQFPFFFPAMKYLRTEPYIFLEHLTIGNALLKINYIMM